MRTSRSIVVAILAGLALVACLLAPLTASAATEPAVAGKITRLKGEAKLTRPGAGKSALAEGSVVNVGDRIDTGDEARLELTLADDTKMTLGGNARLVIDEFVYNPEKSQGWAFLDLIKGAFRFTTGKISGMTDKKVTVKTGFASLSVRGTDFWGGPIDDSHGVLVLEGKVEVKTRKGKVLLDTPKAGTMVAGRKHKPSEVKEWGQAKIDRAVATVTF